MAEHKAIVRWQRDPQDQFLKGKYSRVHEWSFDGGLTLPASPSPAVVPAPFSNAAHVDPEEAFVAAVASCHMLTFLYLASRQGFQIDHYEDEAVGHMTKNENGIPWVSSIQLHPKIAFSGDKLPSAAEEAQLHHGAHEQCFIANSIKTDVQVSSAHG